MKWLYKKRDKYDFKPSAAYLGYGILGLIGGGALCGLFADGHGAPAAFFIGLALYPFFIGMTASDSGLICALIFALSTILVVVLGFLFSPVIAWVSAIITALVILFIGLIFGIWSIPALSSKTK